MTYRVAIFISSVVLILATVFLRYLTTLQLSPFATPFAVMFAIVIYSTWFLLGIFALYFFCLWVFMKNELS